VTHIEGGLVKPKRFVPAAVNSSFSSNKKRPIVKIIKKDQIKLKEEEEVEKPKK
jgi:hypothetical protein